MKFDVIEPNWRELERKLNATKEYCSSRKGPGRDKDCSTTRNTQFPRTVDDFFHEHNVSST